jgi:hypothetical protein
MPDKILQAKYFGGFSAVMPLCAHLFGVRA